MIYTPAYHYTTFAKALGILQDEVIRRSGNYNGEVPAVWFSTNPVFEPGAGMHIHKDGQSREVSFERQATKAGLARFRTDARALMPYVEAVADGLVKPWSADYNNRYVSRYGGSTADWLILPYADFPLSKCTGAELHLEGEWVDMTPESLAKLSGTLPRVIGCTWEDLFGRERRRVPKKRKRKN